MATEASARTRFPEIDAAGTPVEIGRQVGESARDLFPPLVDHIVRRMSLRRESLLQREDILAAADAYFPIVESYSPDMSVELLGMAEAANVTPAEVMLINARSEIPHRISGTPAERSGCTTVAVEAERASDGVGFVGQNWDNDDEMRPYSAVIRRRPTGKPATMTWGQVGLIAYMGLNDSGFGVAMNAIPGNTNVDGLPWYFTVRGVYEARDLQGIGEALERMDRARAGNLGMITREGAVDFEVMAGRWRMVRADEDGLLLHTNHCMHPHLTALNEEHRDSLYGQTFERRSRSRTVLGRTGGKISVDDLKTVLSDHDGSPTSICRHPNDDPRTGADRSVVSMIVEPDAGRMHLTNGNPCNNPYDVYELD
jgi:isopenicillin-N N-acyltransferase like protein